MHDVKPNRLAVTLLTQEHQLRAFVEQDGRRFLDHLNNANTNFLHLLDVEVFRRGQSQLVASLPTAVLRKNNVGVAVLGSTNHEAPEKRANLYTSKQQFPVFLLVLGYEVQGILHLQGSGNLASLLAQDHDGFLPVSGASLTYTGFDQANATQNQVAFVNRRLMSMVHMGQHLAPTFDMSAALRDLMNL